MTRERDSSVSELQGSLAALRQELGAVQSSLAASSQELQQYRSDNSELSASMGQRLARELAEERERGAAAVQEVQHRAEQERREGEARQARTVQHLENRVASLDVQNRDLLEVRYRHEAGLREARAKVIGLEEEVARLRGELGSLRKEREGLEACQGDREKLVGQLTTRVAVLQQELADKAAMSRQQAELGRQGEEGRGLLARELEEKTRLVDRREKAVKTVTEELMKANEIIGKLQVNRETANDFS